jgi:cytochrome c biogenesis protein CcmG/thiol:disulfide interchange protein DsbE
MNRFARAALGVLAVGLVAGGTAVATGATRSAGPPWPVGSAAPTLRGTDLSGQLFDLTGLHGDVVLVSVWASWCRPCRAELPLLAEAARNHPGLQVVGLDFRDSATPARDLLAATGAERIRSVQDPDGRLGIEWGVFGVPESFLVDRAGTVRARRVGAVDQAWLQAATDPLLRAGRTGPDVR